MVLLYSVLANSNGSCSLTADIISSIWLKENKTKWLISKYKLSFKGIRFHIKETMVLALLT